MKGRQPASALPPGARRLVLYSVYDRRGEIEDAVLTALSAIRSHASFVLVVVNGDLAESDRARLLEVADDVIERENKGFDVEAHAEGLRYLGSRVNDFDELVMTNDTWLGPVRPLGPLFRRMGAVKTDFWAMTDHAEASPHPLTGVGMVPYHVQSYWLAVRRSVIESPEWVAYWRQLPPIQTYLDAVVEHETRFTAYFRERGYVSSVAYPYTSYGTENPSLYEADRLVADGCPLLKRRPFFQWPPELAQRGTIGRWTLDEVADGALIDGILRDVVRDAEPRAIYTDAAMLEVLGEDARPYDELISLRVVVIAHIYYIELTHDLLDHIDHLPGKPDLVITTSDEERAAAIRRSLARRPPRAGVTSVRVVASNEGRDQSAFLIAAADVLTPGLYDLVVKVHSKRTPQDGFAVGRHFRGQQLGNLLASAEHASALIALFQSEPGLGIVFPPTIHIGYPTIGHGWWANRPGFEELCAHLGIRVPPDDGTPLAPYGSMFIARPEALALLTTHQWTYAMFGGPDAYRDGGPAHVLERVPSYAAAELGYHTRTVVTPEYFAVSYTALEFTLDRLLSKLPGTIEDRLTRVRQAGHMGDLGLRDILRMWASLNPAAGNRIRRCVDPLRRWKRRLLELRVNAGGPR